MGGKSKTGCPWAQGQSHCVFSKTQKQPQCTYQANTVAGSSLIPHAALLEHPSGTIWTIMDLQGQKNAAYENRPGYLQPCLWCAWIVAFMSSYKMDFSSCGIMLGSGKSSHIPCGSHDPVRSGYFLGA